MARKPLDTTGNEPLAVTLGKINDMFVEVYAGINLAGPTGPTGSTGPTGPTGPTGGA